MVCLLFLICYQIQIHSWTLCLVRDLSLVSKWIIYQIYYFLGTHYFNSFRRKPAISKFDWRFAASHKSSEVFATTTGSFLNKLPMARSPGFGKQFDCKGGPSIKWGSSLLSLRLISIILIFSLIRYIRNWLACQIFSLVDPLYKRYVVLQLPLSDTFQGLFQFFSFNFPSQYSISIGVGLL